MIRRMLVAMAFAVVPVAALAHHNMTALSDFNDRVTLNGKLTQVDWRNPHTYLTIDVQASGATESWQAEGPSPSWFRIRDIGKTDFEGSVGRRSRSKSVARGITRAPV